MILTQIGDYVLVKELGPGSMGSAYLAEHVFLKRPYVIKFLPEDLTGDPDFLYRFEKQIALLSHLDHPHITAIHNATRIQEHYVIVSEAIESAVSLKEYMQQKQGEFSEEEILRIARQIASALDYGHNGKEPTAHGSIKFNNISVLPGKEGPQVFLTDFGLSKILGPARCFARTHAHILQRLENASDPAHVDDALLKLRHSFYQNFAFLAPEQKKQISDAHPKADIYAFGILLYYMLMGEFPEGYFDLPSKRLGEMKWNWDLLICKCLQTDPARRPDQLSAKLDELLATASKSARQQLLKMRDLSEDKSPAKPILKPKEIARPSFDADPGAIFQTETSVAPYKPKVQAQKEIEPLLSDMIVIPASSHMRGSNHGARDEMPRHTIRLSSYAIDIHPVTNEQFVCFLEAMGGEKDVNNHEIIRLRESRIKRSGGSLNIESGYTKHPVVGVTWYGAVAYTKWIGKRLPTEAEWEIAAYGGREDFFFPTGARIERSEANFFSSDTTPVMSYPPNGCGLYDIAGNVYEWCQDWYDFHYYDISVQEPNDPKGPLQGVYRVLRGGCWKSLKEDLRCAHRHRNNPGVMNGTYGFRCAADVTDA